MKVSVESVFVHVTKACNLACEYCYFSARHPMSNEMTPDEYVRLWTELVALGAQKVILTGGEPLLRGDTVQLLTDMRDVDPGHTLLRCLNTNGLLVTLDVASSLIGLVDEIRVSVDASGEVNDLLRGRGSFDAALLALKQLFLVGFEPKVMVTVTSLTLPHINRLVEQLVHAGICRINLNLFKPIGRGAAHPEWVVDHNKYMSMMETLSSKWGLTIDSIQAPEPVRGGNCGAGGVLSISPMGDVFPCHVLSAPQFRYGNLRTQSLTNVLRKSEVRHRFASATFTELRSLSGRSPLNESDPCLGT